MVSELTIREYVLSFRGAEPVARQIARALASGSDLREWAERYWQPENPAVRVWAS